MGKDNTKGLTSKQVNPPNPTGKGGFSDNPQNRSDGRWSKDNSFTYWMSYFKSLPVNDFLNWAKENPENKRSVAADLAYMRVFNARKDIAEFREVADRTEGKAPQTLRLGGDIDVNVNMDKLFNTLQAIIIGDGNLKNRGKKGIGDKGDGTKLIQDKKG